jgi:hypothetical protein
MGCLVALVRGVFALLTGEWMDADLYDGDASDGGTGLGAVSGTREELSDDPPGEPRFGMSTTGGINPGTGNRVDMSTAESAGGVLRDVGTGEILGPNDISQPPSS